MKMIVYRLFPSTCGELDGWRKTYTQDCIKPRIKQKLKIVEERALKLCWSFRTCGIGKRWLGTSKSFRSAAIYAHNVIHQNLKGWFFFYLEEEKKSVCWLTDGISWRLTWTSPIAVTLGIEWIISAVKKLICSEISVNGSCNETTPCDWMLHINLSSSYISFKYFSEGTTFT